MGMDGDDDDDGDGDGDEGYPEKVGKRFLYRSKRFSRPLCVCVCVFVCLFVCVCVCVGWRCGGC